MYLNERAERRVFPRDEDVLALSAFVEVMPEEPTDPAEVIGMLDEVGSPGTVSSTGGRYFGFVTGGAHSVGVGASWLSSAWDQNAATGVMSPVAGVLDTVAGAWLVSLLGLPPGTQTTFVTGTTMANATCLAAGRDRLFHDMGYDSVNDGLMGAPDLRVVVGEEAHASATKALGLIGLGRERVVVVPADDQGRMRADELPAADQPTLVVAQAGNVNSGACDPFEAIADHFAGSPHWLHVDGAFGLWAAASPTRRGLVAGVDRAHSWATDMHKWLNTTYDSAAAFVHDSADLARTFKVGAAYLPDQGRLDPLNRGPDMSQRARAVETWAVLKSLGRSGVAELIDRTCDHAVRIGEELVAAGFQIHNDVVLNQVMVSLDDDEGTQALIDRIASEGEIWAAGSTWRGRMVMRISVSNWSTTDADIDRAIATLSG